MKNKKIIFSIAIFFLLIVISNICMAKDLDRINKYYITVDPRNDGSLDMTYYLEWEVLDSDSEGPLEWVKIGVPNSNIDLVKAISSNIQSVRYYKDGGDYIRIDFKKAYYEGEVISFSFSFHQSYMYDIDVELAKYKFTPGWFNDIEVKEAMVFWKSTDVYSANSKKINDDGYYTWKDSLRKGEKMKVEVNYSRYTRSFDTGKQTMYATKYSSSSSSYNSSYNSTMNIIKIFIILFFVFYVISSVLSVRSYTSHRGYGSRRYYDDDYYHSSSHHHHSSSSSSHSSCVSSCACACACAGGGRAGCSKKDFYGVTVKTKLLNKVVKNK